MFYDADIVHKKCHKREWERLKRDFRLLKRRKKDRGSQKCFYFQGRLFILTTPTLSTLTPSSPPSEKLADLKTDSVSLWKYNEMHLLCCLGKDAGISESSAAARASVGSESVEWQRERQAPPTTPPLNIFSFFYLFFFTHHPPLLSRQQRRSTKCFFSPPFLFSAGRLSRRQPTFLRKHSLPLKHPGFLFVARTYAIISSPSWRANLINTESRFTAIRSNFFF